MQGEVPEAPHNVAPDAPRGSAASIKKLKNLPSKDEHVNTILLKKYLYVLIFCLLLTFICVFGFNSGILYLKFKYADESKFNVVQWGWNYMIDSSNVYDIDEKDYKIYDNANLFAFTIFYTLIVLLIQLVVIIFVLKSKILPSYQLLHLELFDIIIINDISYWTIHYYSLLSCISFQLATIVHNIHFSSRIALSYTESNVFEKNKTYITLDWAFWLLFFDFIILTSMFVYFIIPNTPDNLIPVTLSTLLMLPLLFCFVHVLNFELKPECIHDSHTKKTD